MIVYHVLFELGRPRSFQAPAFKCSFCSECERSRLFLSCGLLGSSFVDLQIVVVDRGCECFDQLDVTAIESISNLAGGFCDDEQDAMQERKERLEVRFWGRNSQL